MELFEIRGGLLGGSLFGPPMRGGYRGVPPFEGGVRGGSGEQSHACIDEMPFDLNMMELVENDPGYRRTRR
jgi:hypothetical protein